MGKAIEIILSRQWADTLSIPVFLTDPEGNLLFYNQPAEGILGKRFDETGPLPVEEWSTMFKPEDKDGRPIPPERLPLVKTIKHRIADSGQFWIVSLTGERHLLSVTSFPVIGISGSYHGAIAIFWTNQEE